MPRLTSIVVYCLREQVTQACAEAGAKMDKEMKSNRLGVSTAASGMCTTFAGMYTLLHVHKVLQMALGI